jgi:nucleoside-diphosphate-sugar epimerase
VKFEELKNKTILVTGGAGFIGSHIVDSLVKIGARVRVLDNFSTGREENLKESLKQIEVITGDIRDIKTCKRACSKVDIVCHQAALGSVPRSLKDPATTIAVNVSGTANIFSSARDCSIKRIVFASSSSVYGDSKKSPKKEGEEGNPLSPYALSKVMDEELAQIFARCFDMELIGLRYFNVYGPRQTPEGPYAAVIPRFFKAYLNNELPIIYGDGKQTRDFTFVSDVVKANLLALTLNKVEDSKCYNVSGGKEMSILELAKLIAGICKKNEVKPYFAKERPGDVKHSLADLSLAKLIKYSPEVSLEKGLKKSLNYYKELFT